MILYPSVSEIQVACVDLVHHIGQIIMIAVGNDHIASALERLQIAHHDAVEEMLFLHCRFVHDDLHAFGFDALHHALNAALAEIIAARLHRQAVHADNRPRILRKTCANQNPLGNKVLAGTIGVDDRTDDVVGHVVVVGQKLLGILGQTVAAVSKGRIVVMAADARIQTHAFNDGLRIQPAHLRIGIQLVKEGYTQRQIRIGKELDGFRFCQTGKEHRNVLLERAFLQQSRKRPSAHRQ